MRRFALIVVCIAIVVVVAYVVGLRAGERYRDAPQPPDSAPAPAQSAAAPQQQAGAAQKGQVMDTSLFRNIAKQENPIVVSVMTQSEVQTSGEQSDLLQRLFGLQSQPSLQRALGSGFIIDKDGEIVTNNHVVAGAQQIKVGLFGDNRRTYDATVVGRDPLSDTALIKLKGAPGNLQVATLGDSSQLQPGDWVMAIGNPFQLGHTVTVGVISYAGRPFAVAEGRTENMLQTDAAINPGNSGGPLIDVSGHVIGINSAILAGEGTGGNIGIGFAVPINTLKTLLPQLRRGKVVRGRLGVRVLNTPITDEQARQLGLPKPEGAIVGMVEHDSPAEKAGIKAGDVIVSYNGKPVSDADALVQMVTTTAPGSKVPIGLYRDGKPMDVTATIEELQVQGEEQAANRQNAASTLGMALQDVTPNIARELQLPSGTTGAVVAEVQPGGAAADAGLRPGDVILEVNRRRVGNAGEAANALRGLRSGQTAFVLVWRQGNQMLLTIQS